LVNKISPEHDTKLLIKPYKEIEMSKLLASRKFLLVCLDALIGLVGLCVGFFVKDPDWQRFVMAFIGFLQPVFVAAIVGVAVEDAAALKAGTHPNQE